MNSPLEFRSRRVRLGRGGVGETARHRPGPRGLGRFGDSDRPPRDRAGTCCSDLAGSSLRRTHRRRGGNRVARRHRRVAALPRHLPELEPRLRRRRVARTLANGSLYTFHCFGPWSLLHFVGAPARASGASGRRGVVAAVGRPATRIWTSPRLYAPAETESVANARALLAAFYLGWFAQVGPLPEGLRVRPGAACPPRDGGRRRRSGGLSVSSISCGSRCSGSLLNIPLLEQTGTRVRSRIPGHSRRTPPARRPVRSSALAATAGARAARRRSATASANTSTSIAARTGRNSTRWPITCDRSTRRSDPANSTAGTTARTRFISCSISTRRRDTCTTARSSAIPSPDDRITKQIAREVAESRQRYVVSDLMRTTQTMRKAYAPGADGDPCKLPDWFPVSQRDKFPWNQPIVFRSGRYVVHKIENPLGVDRHPGLGRTRRSPRRGGPKRAFLIFRDLRPLSTRRCVPIISS